MDFDSNTPIYIQIMDYIKLEIFSGRLSPQSRVSSVRDLALQFSVNPNTVQKALSELERENILHSERTSGRFVSDDPQLIEQARLKMVETLISNFIEKTQQLGYTSEYIAELISKKKGK